MRAERMNEQAKIEHVRTTVRAGLIIEVAAVEADANTIFRNEYISVRRRNPAFPPTGDLKSLGDIWTQACSRRASIDQRINNLDGLGVRCSGGR